MSAEWHLGMISSVLRPDPEGTAGVYQASNPLGSPCLSRVRAYLWQLLLHMAATESH